MTWAFRVDTDRHSGGGHTYRTICLAKEIKKNEKIIFFVNSKTDKFALKVKDDGFQVDEFNNFNKYSIYGCVIDGYNFKKNEIKSIRSKVKKLVQIYDYGQVYDNSDLIISSNDNLQLNEYNQKKRIGLKFTIINPKFYEKEKKINKNVKNVIISFGLIDSKNYTAKVLEIIQKSKFDLKFENIYVAINSKSKFIPELKKIIKKIKCNVTMKEFGDDLVKVVKSCDLAIGAGGISMCERLCSGIPSIVILSSNNQVEITEKLQKKKAIIKLNFLKIFDKKKFQNSLTEILIDFQKRKNFSKIGRKIFDGNGVIRVAETLNGL